MDEIPEVNPDYDFWYKTATEEELKEAVSQVVQVMGKGPCDATAEHCSGCAGEWIESISLIMFGPQEHKHDEEE